MYNTFKQGMLASTLALLMAQITWAEETTTTTPPPTTVPATETTADIQPLVPVVQAQTPRLENSDRLLRLVGTIGLSMGGDTLATAYYTNGDSQKIKAGGLVYLAAGLGLDIPDTPLTLQVLGGYHVDDTSADNGKLTFDRTTLDAQIFYRHGNHRFGVGAVQHRSPEYIGKIDGLPDDRATFEDSSGFSLEYNYLPLSFNWPWKDSRAGFSFRYVQIEYTAKTINGAPAVPTVFSGDHVAAGLYLTL